MSLVLDSSAALAWIYGEETTNAIQEVFDQISKDGAWVPSLWRLEIANILEMGIRRGRHDARFRDATLTD
ncbi:MAG: type II toxin-antitoxin system VapC family toxin, partial [Acidobacteriaceae bacterium]